MSEERKSSDSKHFSELRRRAKVKQFVETVTLAAIEDAGNSIAEYDARNTGQVLLRRLNLPSLRICPRNGDAKYARSIYTAAHWLYRTEEQESK